MRKTSAVSHLDAGALAPFSAVQARGLSLTSALARQALAHNTQAPGALWVTLTRQPAASEHMKLLQTRVLLLVAATLWGVACAKPTAPTYTGAVASLLERRCTRCHAGGNEGIEPPLHTAAQAARAAQAIARTVELRSMPPWGVDNTGHCGTFRHASWLSSDEISTLTGWARAGAPLGAAVHRTSGARATPRAPTTTIGDKGHIVFAAAAFSPGLGAKASRCFLVDAPSHDVVAGSISGAPEHRLVQSLFALQDVAALRQAEQLDRADEEPGFACPADGPAGGRLLLSWSFITPTVELPAAAGLLIPAGRPLVLQARADLVALGLSRSVRPRLSVERREEAPADFVTLRASPRAYGPERTRAEVSVEWVAPRALRLFGVVPRIGSRGRVLDVAVERAGERACAAYFGHWRPSLEQLYLREQPLELKRGDLVRLTCTMSTLAQESAADGNDDDGAASACGGALLLSAAP